VLGFETIGNATLICHDGKPVLVTDPWINNSAYFGSWGLSFDIPSEQLDRILECEYVWFSHGHPDHLNADSLPAFSGRKILLPDHRGGRILEALRALGFNVSVLHDREWRRLSRNIEVMCLADYFQDAILLVRIGNRLVMNFNDAAERGWTRTVRDVARRHRENYLLKISGYGDADMIHLFDEHGTRIEPWAARKFPVGKTLARSAASLGASNVIPFSSFHSYRRTDSLWAGAYTTPITAYPEGFDLPGSQILPPFVQVDFSNGEVRPIHPPESDTAPRSPESCGDNWNDRLTTEDRGRLKSYFLAKRLLRSHLRFVRFRVGAEETVIDLNPRKRAGLTFEAPRNSLMTAVNNEVFDDLLIGNFMKTTLHEIDGLYPWFTPPVAKYSDNGKAQSRREVLLYFAHYLLRNPRDLLLHQIESQVFTQFHVRVRKDGRLFGAAKRTYYLIKGIKD
jgi:hypothetical protein